MAYPKSRPNKLPGSGRELYQHLMRNIAIPASANHSIWYGNEARKLATPEKFAFRGDIPIGKTLELITLAGKTFEQPQQHTLSEKDSYVQVSDLSDAEKTRLGIPATARPRDKVYNNNFKPFEQLPPLTKLSNEFAALSVPKSISSFLSTRRGLHYSEHDIQQMLAQAIQEPTSEGMLYVLHGNHMAWVALAYQRENGNVEGDIMTEYYGQNTTDFYAKDFGTVLPAMFYALALIGTDPVETFKASGLDVWGADEAAQFMQQFLKR